MLNWRRMWRVYMVSIRSPRKAVSRCAHSNCNLDFVMDLLSRLSSLIWWIAVILFECLVDVLFSGNPIVTVRCPFWWIFVRRSVLFLWTWKAGWLARLLLLLIYILILILSISSWFSIRLCLVISTWCDRPLRRHLEEPDLALVVLNDADLIENVLLRASYVIVLVRRECIWAHWIVMLLVGIVNLAFERVFQVVYHLLETAWYVLLTRHLLRHSACIVIWLGFCL